MNYSGYLHQSMLFETLSEEEISKIASIARERTFTKNAKIIQENDMGDSLFIILTGSVRVHKTELSQDEEVISTLHPGDHFGEIALIDYNPRSATVIANETSQLLEIRRNDFQKVLDENDAIALKVYKAFIRALCQRIRETTESFVVLKSMGTASRIVD